MKILQRIPMTLIADINQSFTKRIGFLSDVGNNREIKKF